MTSSEQQDGMAREFKIGGFWLCHRHGPVKNGEACPQCELDALLTPEQKALQLKAWAQEQVRKSNEHFKELSQIFTEGNAIKRGRPSEIPIPEGQPKTTGADASMVQGTGSPAQPITPPSRR